MVSRRSFNLAARMVGAGLVGVAAGFFPTPAASHHISPTPVVEYPQVAREFLLVGPPNIWGMRSTARDADARLPIKIWFGGDHPGARRIVVTFNPGLPANVGGLCYCQVEYDPARLELNPKYGPNHRLAAHEFGHALGLGHHNSPGLMYGGKYLSALEAQVLRAHYAQ